MPFSPYFYIFFHKIIPKKEPSSSLNTKFQLFSQNDPLKNMKDLWKLKWFWIILCLFQKYINWWPSRDDFALSERWNSKCKKYWVILRENEKLQFVIHRKELNLAHVFRAKIYYLPNASFLKKEFYRV